MKHQSDVLGFVGVGVMGAGMCRNLVNKSGLPVHAADLDPHNVEKAVAHGAIATDVVTLSNTATTVFSVPALHPAGRGRSVLVRNL